MQRGAAHEAGVAGGVPLGSVQLGVRATRAPALGALASAAQRADARSTRLPARHRRRRRQLSRARATLFGACGCASYLPVHNTYVHCTLTNKTIRFSQNDFKIFDRNRNRTKSIESYKILGASIYNNKVIQQNRYIMN